MEQIDFERMALQDSISWVRQQIGFIEPDLKVNFGGSRGMPYLSLGKLLSVVNPLLETAGLSVNIIGTKIKHHAPDTIIRFTVEVANRNNEKAIYRYDLIIDDSGNRSSVQNVGSTISYAMRYIYKMLFAIPSGEFEDPDLQNPFSKVENNDKLLEYYKLSKKEKDPEKAVKILRGLIEGKLEYDRIKTKYK